MPKTIRELLSELRKLGFTDRGGKGSHRNLYHEKGFRITISGKLGDDAKRYQERHVQELIKKLKNEKEK